MSLIRTNCWNRSGVMVQPPDVSQEVAVKAVGVVGAFVGANIGSPLLGVDGDKTAVGNAIVVGS